MLICTGTDTRMDGRTDGKYLLNIQGYTLAPRGARISHLVLVRLKEGQKPGGFTLKLGPYFERIYLTKRYSRWIANQYKTQHYNVFSGGQSQNSSKSFSAQNN